MAQIEAGRGGWSAESPRWRANFLVLWAGQSISLLGDNVSYVALPLFVAHLTGSALHLGLTSASETLPTLLLGLVAGVVLDRVRMRPVLILGDLVRAAGFASLAIAAGGGPVRIWMVFAVAFLAGSCKVFFDSGLQAWMPSVVPAGYLAKANSYLQISQSLALPLGAALAGYIVASRGFSTAFAVNALTFVVSAASLLLLRGVRAKTVGARSRFGPELREGLAYLWRLVPLRLFTLSAALANLVVAPLEATLVLLAEQRMGLDSSAIGLLFAVIGVGAVVGAVTAPRLSRQVGLGRAFVWGLAMLGTGLFLASFALDFVSGAAAIFLTFFGFSWLQIAFVTFRQIITPEPLLGRVTAASRTIAWASLPVGAAFGGLLAEYFGVVALFRAAPLAVIVTAAVLRLTPAWTATEEALDRSDSSAPGS